MSLLKKVVFKVHAACPEGVRNGKETSMGRLISQYLFLLTLYDDVVKEEAYEDVKLTPNGVILNVPPCSVVSIRVK